MLVSPTQLECLHHLACLAHPVSEELAVAP